MHTKNTAVYVRVVIKLRSGTGAVSNSGDCDALAKGAKQIRRQGFLRGHRGVVRVCGANDGLASFASSRVKTGGRLNTRFTSVSGAVVLGPRSVDDCPLRNGRVNGTVVLARNFG
jgi:hypothetical protein